MLDMLQFATGLQCNATNPQRHVQLRGARDADGIRCRMQQNIPTSSLYTPNLSFNFSDLRITTIGAICAIYWVSPEAETMSTSGIHLTMPSGESGGIDAERQQVDA
jgi:hypothetical protein